MHYPDWSKAPFKLKGRSKEKEQINTHAMIHLFQNQKCIANYIVKNKHFSPVVQKVDNTILHVRVNKTYWTIHWIEIYSADSINHPNQATKALTFTFG